MDVNDEFPSADAYALDQIREAANLILSKVTAENLKTVNQDLAELEPYPAFIVVIIEVP